MQNVIAYLRSDATKQRIVSLIYENILLYQGIRTDDQIQKFSGLMYNQFVTECVQNNQYISLSNKTMDIINDIYRELVVHLCALSGKKYGLDDIEALVVVHRSNLIAALLDNEYEDTRCQLFIPCAEYTGEFQNEILRIDVCQLAEPVIDIGCGISYELIKLLRRNGYTEVYGLDQYVSSDSRIACSNWFDYQFQPSTWGTAIAHMSFSNHLRRSLINNDDNKEAYIHKYHEILLSLKAGGIFIYTPSVKELEDTLERTEYTVQYYRNRTDRNLDTVYVRKLC
jgi:hypothetical protein